MSGKPSIGKELFDSIVEHTAHPDTVTMLRSMVNSTPPTVESEYLDFKSASQGGMPIPDGDMKKTWSEALAGFATTSGGVLIWGIDARKPTGSTVDQASGFNLVVDPDGFRSRLQQLQHQATDPPVPGVTVKSYPDPSAPGQGFVVCYIPESDYKPHRTEQGGKRWVMRIGDSFVDVPPPVLRSLFFPHRHSYIFMRVASSVEYSSQRETSGVVKVTFHLRLFNEGPATATDLVVLAMPIEGMQFLSIPLWNHVNTPVGNRLGYEQAFHPGQMIEVPPAAIDLPLVPRMARDMGRAGNVDLEFQLYATDQVPQQLIFRCGADDILQQKEWTALPEPISITRYR